MPGERPEFRAPEGRHSAGGLECRSRMRHTHMCVFLHVVFSTKNRRNTIRETLRNRLWSYMGGIARAHKLHAIIIGGMETMSICCSQFPRLSRSQEQFS